MYVGKRTVLAKTCRHCNELRQGDEYHKDVRSGCTQSWCKYCTNVMSKNYATDSQRKSRRRTQAKATRVYVRWTTKELEKLKELYENGTRHEEIAYELGRTLSSINNTYLRYFTDAKPR